MTTLGEKERREGERAENHCPVPFTTQTCIDFQFQYSYNSQSSDRHGEAAGSQFAIKPACLFVFIHITVPQNIFFIKLAGEEAGQTSLEKAGQRVFRWTEPGRGRVSVTLRGSVDIWEQ